MSRLPRGFAETATSQVSRLAAYYGAKSAELFSIDVGLDYRSIVLGRRDAVQKLAELAEVDAELLKRTDRFWERANRA